MLLKQFSSAFYQIKPKESFLLFFFTQIKQLMLFFKAQSYPKSFFLFTYFSKLGNRFNCSLNLIIDVNFTGIFFPFLLGEFDEYDCRLLFDFLYKTAYLFY